jgi:hypothetical protein
MIEFRNPNSINFAEKTAILKIDSLGNEAYRFHPGVPETFSVAGWVVPTNDGYYLTAWSDPSIIDTNPQINQEKTIWLKKFDLEGNSIFELDFYDQLPKTSTDRGYSYQIKQMIEAADGNIILMGFSTTLNAPGFIMKITQQGTLIWHRFITPPQAEGNTASIQHTELNSITETQDGGFIMAGEYYSIASDVFPEGIQTAIAVKVDQYGCLEPGCHLADNINEYKQSLGLQVFPNPARDQVTVLIDHAHQIQSINLFDISGKMIMYPSPPSTSLSASAGSGNSSGNSTGLGNSGNGSLYEMKVDVSNLKTGLYLIEVVTKDGLREAQRVVIPD